jgi:hypothetical protein
VDKLDWSDLNFREIKDGSVINFYDGDKVHINYHSNNGKSAV